ncbi:helix-turn-helix domain-containing protein [Wenzhouxiangella sp. AB-CW3]|uniref:helix-turn-helix domain-containing protein n=1 Tax=Wenzhouxiangella sp. AB-CW3 TaxID=2771012 RepID=UPI00168BE1D6|nr:helix-turn-helix domain-containing protein [Wenzhouxiangella sp. AB-CW3]QOC22272.1 helix-turn-helix domain-containing protein [Wenzhouxiangella sp. AB-CW3]
MSDRTKVTDLDRTEVSCEDCALFSLCFAQEISDDERQDLHKVLKRRQPVERNDHLFHGGQRLKSVAVLRTGSVKAYNVSHDGDEIVSGFYLPGEVIGLDALSSEKHPGFAVALEDSRYCEIPYRDFERMLAESPKLNQVMLRMLSEEMTETRELLLVVGRLDARTRVSLFLLSLSRRLARRKQDPDCFRLTMDRRDVANYLGLTIETVSRTLSALQRENIIEVRGKQVRILDRSALQRAARQLEELDPVNQNNAG